MNRPLRKDWRRPELATAADSNKHVDNELDPNGVSHGPKTDMKERYCRSYDSP